MVERIRVGIRTDGHTAAAVGADGVPVAKAQVRVDFPAHGAIDLTSIIERDGLGRTVLGALATHPAKIDHTGVWRITIRNQI